MSAMEQCTARFEELRDELINCNPGLTQHEAEEQGFLIMSDELYEKALSTDPEQIENAHKARETILTILLSDDDEEEN